MLLGRDAELSAIDQALASARLGKSSRVLIRGEPGIGKTALLEYAVARAGSMRVLAARGVEFEADVPFAGLHQLFHPTLALLDRLPPIHAAALRSSLGLGARIEADRLIIGAAALGLISAYAEEAPLLITLDDAQWLDRASAEAVAFAARRLFADPVAIVIALRGGEDSPLAAAGLPELRLQGLDSASATALLEQAASERVSPDVARWMLEATGGNPLALIELGHEAPRMSASPHDTLPIATSVERAYLRRADGLSEGARRVLLLMAASGTAELGLVQRAARAFELSPVDVEQAEAAAGLVMQRADRVEFVHPLARAAIYHAATPADRRAAHRALARVMTEPDDADRQAWHLASASTGWDADAATALEGAARRARESSGYAAAASAWAESARLTEMPELKAARIFNAADNAWLAGRVEDAVGLLAEARNHAETRDLRIDIDTLSGHIAMRRGSVVEGYRLLVAAAGAVERVDRLKAIRILADAVLSTFGAGRPSDMLADAQKAIGLLRPDDPPEVAIFAHVAYGALVVLAGHGSDGPTHFRQSVELFKKVPAENADPLVLICACFVGLFLREAEAGRDLLERAVILAREHAPTAALPTLLFMLGRDAAATDRWALARANYEEGDRVARETTQFTRLSGGLAGLAWLDALEGRVDECRTHAAEAIQLCDEYGMGLYKAWSLTALGQLEQSLGHQEEALQYFVSCESVLSGVSINDPDISPLPDIVDTLVRLSRHPEAREAAARYQPSAEAKA